MKKILLGILILLASTGGIVYAEETPPADPPLEEEVTEEIVEETPGPVLVDMRLSISTNSESIYDSEESVAPCNSNNGATEATLATSYCAVLASGIDSEWNWDWAPGAFLDSLNGIAGFTSQDSEGNDQYHFWSWYLNGSEASTALNQYELQAGDLIEIKFIEPEEEITPEPEPETPAPSSSSGSSGSSSRSSKSSSGEVLGAETTPVFNLKKAYEFLLSEQKEDGSFGEDIFTDWVAIALASSETQTYKIEIIVKLVKYYSENKPAGANLADYERRAMALMSLGLDPYNHNDENYIQKIVASFDGNQFGETTEDNDDIFALLVLANAGYNPSDKMMQDSLSFVLDRQHENGSWDGSVDMTGAGMQVLALFNNGDEKVVRAIARAKEFLKQNQEKNSSWSSDVSSTAWALGGIQAIGEKIEDWDQKYSSPLDFFAVEQDSDGGIKDKNTSNRIWRTAYVVTSLSGKTWDEAMQNFKKVEISKVTVKAPLLKQATTKPQKPISVATELETIPNETIRSESTPKESYFLKSSILPALISILSALRSFLI